MDTAAVQSAARDRDRRPAARPRLSPVARRRQHSPFLLHRLRLGNRRRRREGSTAGRRYRHAVDGVRRWPRRQDHSAAGPVADRVGCRGHGPNSSADSPATRTARGIDGGRMESVRRRAAAAGTLEPARRIRRPSVDRGRCALGQRGPFLVGARSLSRRGRAHPHRRVARRNHRPGGPRPPRGCPTRPARGRRRRAGGGGVGAVAGGDGGVRRWRRAGGPGGLGGVRSAGRAGSGHPRQPRRSRWNLEFRCCTRFSHRAFRVRGYGATADRCRVRCASVAQASKKSGDRRARCCCRACHRRPCAGSDGTWSGSGQGARRDGARCRPAPRLPEMGGTGRADLRVGRGGRFHSPASTESGATNRADRGPAHPIRQRRCNLGPADRTARPGLGRRELDATRGVSGVLAGGRSRIAGQRRRCRGTTGRDVPPLSLQRERSRSRSRAAHAATGRTADRRAHRRGRHGAGRGGARDGGPECPARR
ncbi:Methionyl-tRNA synthetase [Rhodococcus sp. B7740]|nr:Methionyl-tRNA synthetase [Rhodococcus sp. B7740]